MHAGRPAGDQHPRTDQQADLTAVGPSPKASKVHGPDMRVTGLLYGDVRVESDRANAAAEPWPSLLTTLRAVYADLLADPVDRFPGGGEPDVPVTAS